MADCQGPFLSPAEQAELVTANQRYALWVVNRFYSHLRGDDFDDAVGAASLGLVLAAQRFDPALGFTFRTYAEGWCRNCVRRQRRADRRRGMRSSPVDGPGLVSLDVPIGDSQVELSRLVAGVPGPDPAARLDVEALLAELPDRWRAIIVAVDLDDEAAVDVARRFGISRARVGQIRQKAIERLRKVFGITVA